MTDPLLRIAGLTKHYDGRAVVDALDLSVFPGEIFTLLGPSGAGKSTTLKMILGLVRPDHGHIILAGRDLRTVPIHERKIGMVYQDYGLFPSMSARENIAFPEKAKRARSLRGMLAWILKSQARSLVYKNVDNMIALVGLEEHSARRPRELSGGEQQRVALARALLSNPDLLCLDEPFSSVDRYLRTGLQRQLLDLQEKLGRTVLFVTHDQSEAFKISNRLGILNKGRLAQVGTPKEIYFNPANLFVARFLGSENILPIKRVCSATEVETFGGARFQVAKTPGPAHSHVLIRPQNLHLSRGAAGSESYFEAAIKGTAFGGSSVSVSLRLQTGEELQLEVPSSHSDIPPENATVGIIYHREDVVLLTPDTLHTTKVDPNT